MPRQYDASSSSLEVTPLQILTAGTGRQERLTATKTLTRRAETLSDWPDWANPNLVAAYQSLGISRPWVHQVDAANAIQERRHTALATATGTGKSLGFWLPVLSQILDATAPITALYLSPTKALAADQLAALRRFQVALPAGMRPLQIATCDGDTPRDQRRFIQEYGDVVLTNPDFLHYSMLPGHRRWAPFLKSLKVVVIDEGHYYRGVFGAHVAQVLRRLTRLVRHYGGASPVFVISSATSHDPTGAAARLIGVAPDEVYTVTDDTAPHGDRVIALWQPPEIGSMGTELPDPISAAPDLTDPSKPPEPAPFGVIPAAVATRRSAPGEAAELLADLASTGLRSLVFTRSRRSAETIASATQSRLRKEVTGAPQRIAAYRGGFLPEERRALEAAVRSGEILGLATTNALELGVDISGLDAVLIAGWPGTMMSLWQQAGRAGRAGADGLVVFIARDDPLDQYLVTHPEAVFDRPLESVVFNPGNKFVIAGHLCAAAAEKPILLSEISDFGAEGEVAAILDELTTAGLLRRRETGWFWTHSESAAALVDLRGGGGPPIRVVEAHTGRLLGTVDSGAADGQVHTGAVYVHQGEMFVVEKLDLSDRVAFVTRRKVDYGTWSRQLLSLTITDTEAQKQWGPIGWGYGPVEVTTQVVSFERRRIPDLQVLGTEPLELPERTLSTVASWFTVPTAELVRAGLTADQVPGALHAAEHAMISLLPLFATCDRLDLGGLSTDLHPDTGAATVFIFDAYPGGAGFANRGYEIARDWVRATRDLILNCGCDSGCPSCIQSPKCGNFNSPLDKPAAIKLLGLLLADDDDDRD
ncbi:MAG: DEAD/DEAH box helicase [Promicromonosporaceae bacterium]|nr:DEAD/DEAH box helicase [Promicromonosporaceae bacterium]